MKRRYSFTVWFETEAHPQDIRDAVVLAMNHVTSKVGMVSIQPLARRTYMILVPTSDRGNFIASGSAVIGAWWDNGTEIEIYYEGAVHQQKMSFEDKCLHAADRFITRYPTSARALLPASDLKQIGVYSFNDDGSGRQVEITDARSFMTWIGLPVPELD